MYIAGLDECGKGSGFHVLLVCIATIEKDKHKSLTEIGVTDSKKLSPKRRKSIYNELLPIIDDYGIGWSTAREIDTLGINEAHSLASKRAYKYLDITPDKLYVDGRERVDIEVPQETIIKGDLKIPIISAASILGKVIRDEWICKIAKDYPSDYDLLNNKGYLTKKHRETLIKLGMGLYYSIIIGIHIIRITSTVIILTNRDISWFLLWHQYHWRFTTRFPFYTVTLS